MRDEDLILKKLRETNDEDTLNSDVSSESPLAALLSKPVSENIEPTITEAASKPSPLEEPEAEEPPPAPETPAAVPKSTMLRPITPAPSLQDPALIAAQEAANRTRLLAGLGRAAAQAGGALAAVGGKGITAPSRPDVSGFEEISKEAETPVSQLIQRKQMEAENLRMATQRNMADPRSSISEQYRKLFNKYMPELKMPDTASALDIQSSGYGKLAEQLAAVDLKRQERQALRQESKGKETDRRFSKLGEKLVAETSSSRSAFGKAANTVRGAEAIERMVDQIDPNNLDNRQIAELARNLDSMLSQGQATVAGMKKLLPETALGSASKMMEYIGGIPRGAQQGQFVRRMMDTVKREKSLAQDQIKRTQGKVLAGYSDLEDKDPERWNQLMQIHGIKTEEEPEPSKKDPIQEYADKYLGGNYKAAVELLRKRGQL